MGASETLQLCSTDGSNASMRKNNQKSNVSAGMIDTKPTDQYESVIIWIFMFTIVQY